MSRTYRTRFGWIRLLSVLMMIGTVLSPKVGHSQADPKPSLLFVPAVMDQQPEDATFEVSTDPNDPHWMRATRRDKFVVDYFGARSDAGVPSVLEYINVTDSRDDSSVTITFEDDMPVNFTTEDGTSFDMLWLSDTEIRVTAATANGEYEVSIPVDLADPKATRQFRSPVAAATHTLRAPYVDDTSHHRPGSLFAGPLTARPAGTLAAVPLAESTTSLYVTKCQEPFDPRSVKVRYESRSLLPYVDYFAYRLRTGEYAAAIPTDDRSTEIADTLEKAVELASYGCTAISSLSRKDGTSLCAAIGVRDRYPHIPSVWGRNSHRLRVCAGI